MISKISPFGRDDMLKIQDSNRFQKEILDFIILASLITKLWVGMNLFNYYIYIISNWNNKVIYIGVTNNLERRIFEHKSKLIPGFSSKYNLNKLVYYEQYVDIREAITREKELKKWKREKKNKLIESTNPEWMDLSNELIT